jgi:hypothetical protein
VLPVAAMFLTLVAIVAVFFYNVAMFSTNASTATDGALRAGGLAAIAQVDPGQNYGRWYVDPQIGTRLARDYIRSGLSAYKGMFTWPPDTVFPPPPPPPPPYDVRVDVLDASGTADMTKNGVDVEIISPMTDPSQTSSAHFYNCDPAAATCSSDPQVQISGVFPEAVRSKITETYYSVGTIILRSRLSITQMGGATTIMTRIVVIRAGTDDHA